ncbi:MAG TPA: hypothetical protein VK654_03925 [Nitrospirota bacterium]|nr:hypothetical protein [Nitrospirota bacterium]
MQSEQIDVISYSGRKGDERPATFILHGLRIDVAAIIENWIEENYQDRARKRYFRVRGSDGALHLIYFDLQVHAWFYASRNITTH